MRVSRGSKRFLAFCGLLSLLFGALQCTAASSGGQQPAVPVTTVSNAAPQATGVTTPTIPRSPSLAQQGGEIASSAATGAGFAPASWHVLKAAEGDLNGDGRTDAVVIFTQEDPTVHKYELNTQQEQDLNKPRVLVIALRDDANRLQRAEVSSRAVLCRNCGGMFDEPVLELSVAGGVVTLEQASMGGGSEVSYTHRFRYQQGAWLLIGATTEQLDKNTATTRTKDINYLTGAVLEETRGLRGKDADAVLSHRKYRQRLIPSPLAEFDIETSALK